MCSLPVQCFVLVLLCCSFPSLATSSTETPPERVVETIIAWVQSKGGYWNEKVEIRRVHVTPTISYMGVFAKHALASHEKIMNIPHACYISVEEPKSMDLPDEEQNMKNYHQNVCLLSKKMKQEMELGEESAYAPYVAYLKQQGKGQLPATWSEEGKNLLRKYLPKGSDVVDWMERYYKEDGADCFDAGKDYDEQEHLLAMTVQRCYDTSLIPLWDMVNHDNMRINTNNTSMYADDGMTVWASQPIAAGDEILATYDECVDCLDIEGDWGTPEVLRDFGFVERWARRWVFKEQKVWFEILEETTGERTLFWDDDESFAKESNQEHNWGPPSRNATAFLVAELNRIKEVGSEEVDVSRIPPGELSTILQYKEAAEGALSLAIQVATQFHDTEGTCAESKST